MQITKGKINTAIKCVVYGPEGIGKSTFAAHFPDPLFIDTEGSTKLMDVSRLPKPSSWTMLMEEIRYVKSNPSICRTLVIDTADWAEQLCISEICAKAQKSGIEDFGYGKGYVYLEEEFGRMLNLLEDLVEIGINVTVTAHAQMRKIEQPDEMGSYDHWELKLEKKTAPLLKEWADMVLFANYKTYVVNVDGQGTQKGKNKAQGGKRVMYTMHHPCWDAKNRHGLRDELPFDFSEIASCLSTDQKNTTPPALPVELQQTSTMLAGRDTAPTPRKQAVSNAPSVPDSPVPNSTPPQQSPKEQPDLYEGIPKALLDLMRTNDVGAEEIQYAVASKGYYPEDTPIKNYDPNFISGVLIGAWPQVFDMIKALRELPFNS